jgi:antitoxin CptB
MNDKNEELEVHRRKLKFRAWHRGTREMDLLMGSFADRHIFGFDKEELDEFERLLSCNDPDLYNWVTGVEVPPANEQSSVLSKFLGHRIHS